MDESDLMRWFSYYLWRMSLAQVLCVQYMVSQSLSLQLGIPTPELFYQLNLIQSNGHLVRMLQTRPNLCVQ